MSKQNLKIRSIKVSDQDWDRWQRHCLAEGCYSVADWLRRLAAADIRRVERRDRHNAKARA